MGFEALASPWPCNFALQFEGGAAGGTTCVDAVVVQLRWSIHEGKIQRETAAASGHSEAMMNAVYNLRKAKIEALAAKRMVTNSVGEVQWPTEDQLTEGKLIDRCQQLAHFFQARRGRVPVQPQEEEAPEAADAAPPAEGGADDTDEEDKELEHNALEYVVTNPIPQERKYYEKIGLKQLLQPLAAPELPHADVAVQPLPNDAAPSGPAPASDAPVGAAPAEDAFAVGGLL